MTRAFQRRSILYEHICLLEGVLISHEDLLKGEWVVDEQLLRLWRTFNPPHSH